MNLRSLLILVSLAASAGLVISLNASVKRANEARQALMQQSSEISRLRSASTKIKPGMGGLSASGMATELALLQKIKLAVASEVSRGQNRDVKCARGSAGDLGRLMNGMTDFKKKLDALLESTQKDARNRDEMVARVEEEARKMKEELITLCSR